MIAFGLRRWFVRRHPRALARVRPTQIALWSFLMATAHGAGLMLVPVVMGLCSAPPTAIAGLADRAAMLAWIGSNVATALAVALAHTAATIVAGIATALPAG